MHIAEIKDRWMQLTGRWGGNKTTAQEGIDAIISRYARPGRHYHTIEHVSDLLCLQDQYAPLIVDNDSVQYAVFFHDIVYSSTRKDNEEKSAQAAVKFLQQIGYPDEKQQKIYRFITATANHLNPLGDPDLDYLLDFDLHILGAAPAQYDAYTKQIRKEYWIYPVFVYNKGRKKVLQHFLSQPHIYKTPPFREKYEQKARENLERELERL